MDFLEKYKDYDFEKAMQSLEKIVQILDKNQVGLEEGVALFQEGSFLSSLCQQKLDEAKLSLKQYLPSTDEEIDL